MTINLSDYESGDKYDGNYGDALKALQDRLAHIHFKHIIHRSRSILVFEGWDAAGKGGAIRRMTGEWDPRYFDVWPIGAPTKEEKDRHFLWRFWQKLPGSREIGVFDRSWYGRVLVERVEGFCEPADWKRGYDEINEFEAQQIDGGTNLVKIFFHTTQEEQDARLAKRLDTPHKRWKITAEDFRNREKRDDYLEAMHDMFENTDTRWAPWKVIDGNDKKSARIAAMTHVAETLEAALPDELPVADPELVKLAEQAFGYEAKD
ncbi:polyphosphate kinase 2 family protein [Parasphingorhabdus sp.]|jgi:polyphosphate kinase 2 (PPK2 family)|uniref:polyphosphate kinase 2 family protein n=1 Tax=Parasphingorhabdus sp. TaxID=2709688 RepID=UPI0030019F8F